MVVNTSQQEGFCFTSQLGTFLCPKTHFRLTGGSKASVMVNGTFLCVVLSSGLLVSVLCSYLVFSLNFIPCILF